MRMRVSLPLLLLLLALALGAGCRSAPLRVAPETPQGPAVSGNDRDRDGTAPVAVIRGQRLSKSMLADHWFDRYPEEYVRTLESLIDEQVVIADANRIGIRVPAAELDKAVRKEVEARTQQIATIYGDQVSLAEEVRRAYGMDLSNWRRTVLGPRLHLRLVMERLIRWESHQADRLHARVIVLDDPERARRIAQKIRRGADFSLTALKESKDPSGKRGGNLPMIRRGDLAFPGVEERLFAARPGALVGPLQVQVDGAPQWQLYRVVERKPAWTGTYESNWQRIEKDLAERPVTPNEFERWRARVRRDGHVRYYRPDGREWSVPTRR